MVCKPAREHVGDRGAVPVHPLHLVERALVVVEPEPGHPMEDRVDGLGRRALDVGILDAQDELAVMMSRERPGEERGARASEVQEAGRAGREAGADGGHDGRACQRRASVGGTEGSGVRLPRLAGLRD